MSSRRCAPEPRICSTSSRAFGGERAVDLGDEDVGEAEDGVERAPELVAHGGEERGALAIGGRRAREVVAVRPLRGAKRPTSALKAPASAPTSSSVRIGTASPVGSVRARTIPRTRCVRKTTSSFASRATAYATPRRRRRGASSARRAP
jgi:hypothetical protein